MKKILSLILLGCFGLSVMSQTDTEVKKQINKIKRSRSYLSAEATMATEEEAKSVALELLVGEINDWVDAKRKAEDVKQVVLQDINTTAQQMDMKRGTKSRVFVYVKKKDIVLICGEGQLVLNDDELQPLSAITSQNSDISQETPVQDNSEPQESQIENSSKLTNASEQDSENVEEKETLVQVSKVKEEDTSVLTSNPLSLIKGAKTMTEMKPVFAKLKGEGKITYGAYKGGELKENCYLLFYDRAGNIKAVVKKSGDTMTDTQNGTEVTLASFSGMGVYWFVLN